ncbi:MAG TPA: DUF5597 domain-containing protein [Opitutus sp.]|nr:DUF5597 domain-containing protein [Opitutus sp.]
MRFSIKLLIVAFQAAAIASFAAEPPSPPHLVEHAGRHALIVDDAPFLILGGQCHNSSAWPATLPAVWSAIEAMHANTLEVPISWEQFEPEPNRFDNSIVDLLLQQAREHRVRLVLLWFGTWKNGSAHYLPLWIKSRPEKYPRVIGRDGRPVDSPSPHSPALLAADQHAFAALMRHLESADPQHTVIMVQVENEPGTWGSVRDFSPAAQKLFESPVPAELLHGLKPDAPAGANWRTAFGPDADEFFHAWSVARYIDQVAAAGKAEYPLPLYVNVALRDPLTNPPATSFESGGATDDVLGLWKIAAPHVDLLAPDIYQPDPARYLKVLDLYARADNPLFVPETIGSPSLSRFCFTAFARGAIGWSPFGIDNQRAVGPIAVDEAASNPIAAGYRVLGANLREFARLAFEGRLHAATEEKDSPSSTLALGRWQVAVSYGPPTFGYGRMPKGNPEPIGRALIAQLGNDEFLVTGYLARVDFKTTDTTSSEQREYLRVEEGGYENGAFHPIRIWNGDETDWGLNFGTKPQLVRVHLGTY